MADLTSIFKGGFSPPAEVPISRPEDQLRDSIISANLTPPDEIIMDGQIHRFKSTAKSKDKSGWYIVYSDGTPMGRFGCWRSGVEGSFKADVGRKYTPAEEMSFIKRMAEAKALRDAELQRQRELAANTVEIIWTECTPAHPEHPYLKRKGIGVHGARVTGDGRLVVPLYDQDGEISSLQYISADGKKLYHTGGATGSRFWIMGEVEKTLYIAEGFATAATIRESTGQSVVIAYSASNLVPVTEIMRRKYGVTQDIVIVADNDASGVGLRYAEQASAKYGARIVYPPTQGDANDYVQAGNDLLTLLEPQQDDWLVSADEFCAKPAPISWLVKSWLQSEALIMVHGPSGGGKTFAMLDWCLRIASNCHDWFGHVVRPASVVYLAGEGHHGLKARIAAWKFHFGVKSLNMWLSKDGCDLNTPAGYQRVLDHLRALPEKPKLIVVDTLHRFLAGDENSAQDAKTMLDACGALMREFNCSVALVHHTGVSTEAQHRARGSSAWRGALDIEISIVPGSADKPMEIHQRKSKDAELAAPLYATLESVAIPEWFDEDGQPVTSAVLIQCDTPIKQEKGSKISNYKETFINAWYESGTEIINNSPYVTRSALKDQIIKESKKKLSERTLENYVSPAYKNHIVGALTDANLLEVFQHGWIVTDGVMSSKMMVIKNEKEAP
jgi:putative DNA primase/helicase